MLNAIKRLLGAPPSLNERGAEAFRTKHDTSGWHPIATAPRDGTVVEIRCSYGLVPWYGLHRWADDGLRYAWIDANDDCKSVDDAEHLMWRPWSGSTADYVDPTDGAQYEGAYTRGAIAASMGLPPNALEHLVKR